MNRIEILKRVPIFSNLDHAALELLAGRMIVRQYVNGHQFLVEDGEQGAFYVILEGRVSIQKMTRYKRTVVITQRGPLEHFGEMSLLDGQPPSASVVAMGDCRVLTIDRDDFVETVKKHPSLALALLHSLTKRLRELTVDVTRTKGLDLRGNLCATLLLLANEDGEVLGMSHQQLADQIGVTRESVSRMLNELRTAGCIETGQKLIRVIDEDSLFKWSGETNQ